MTRMTTILQLVVVVVVVAARLTVLTTRAVVLALQFPQWATDVPLDCWH